MLVSGRLKCHFFCRFQSSFSLTWTKDGGADLAIFSEYPNLEVVRKKSDR